MPEEPTESSSTELAPEARIAALETQLADAQDQFLRARADFHNLKRRTEEERDSLRAFLVTDLLGRLLPVVDNLDRALTSAATAPDFDAFRTGIEGIRRQMDDLLVREGVEPIVATGAVFDPNLHNAILRDESSDAPENTVVEELQLGYTLHGKVLRAALVKVSAG
ncbi:MAG: nucleotide exchange factor GrpE [Armatimonadaceae bacterium]